MTRGYTRTYGRTRSRNMDISIIDNNPHIYEVIAMEKLTGPVHLEIGFGNGENILHRSVNQLGAIQVGVDVYKNGICKVLKKIKEGNISNIYIANMDVRDFIIKNPDFRTDYLYIMFPDPWHKKSEKKKQKKRLINNEFLYTLVNIVNHNGYIVFASDHQDYYEAIKSYLLPIMAENKISIQSETVNAYPTCFSENYFIPSNYEQKATNDCYYIVFRKS